MGSKTLCKHIYIFCYNGDSNVITWPYYEHHKLVFPSRAKDHDEKKSSQRFAGFSKLDRNVSTAEKAL